MDELSEGDLVTVIRGELKGKRGTLISIEWGSDHEWATIEIDGEEEILARNDIKAAQGVKRGGGQNGTSEHR